MKGRYNFTLDPTTVEKFKKKCKSLRPPVKYSAQMEELMRVFSDEGKATESVPGHKRRLDGLGRISRNGEIILRPSELRGLTGESLLLALFGLSLSPQQKNALGGK